LAARVLCQLVSVLAEFEQQGLAPFMAEWAAWDVLAGKQVTLTLPRGTTQGVARGVDESGALLLASDGQLQRYHSAEVSVRMASPTEGNTQ